MSPRGRPKSERGRGAAAVVAASLALTGCATTSASGGRAEAVLGGSVLDPHGQAVPFARISVIPTARWDDAPVRRGASPAALPAGVSGLAVTDQSGSFAVDRFGGPDGTELPLAAGWYYEVTVYKSGYHLWKDSVAYGQGLQEVAVTLYPDTVAIDDAGSLVDTSLGGTNTGAGVLRQGE